MSDWTSGYIADIGYTFGYYAELQPLRMKLPFTASGLASPRVATACELGFGQGLSANIHAAASGAQWWGTDFNPAQAGFAQELAQVSGAPVHLFDQSFEEFCGRADLPDFDFIALQGIWSWISDENRKIVVDFIRRKLKVGGVVYVSYNALPGQAPMIPVRHLLTRHAELLGAPGEGIVKRIDGALDFAEALLKLNPTYARVVPQLADRLATIKKQDRHYLAHEYFNRDWHPMNFLEMADCMASAKLGYGCSANFIDHADWLNLTADQQSFIKTLPDPMLREAARDFIVNAQFRRDYWVKGPRALSVIDRIEDFRAQRVLLMTQPDKVALSVNGALGEGTLNPDVCRPLLEALGERKALSLADLETALNTRNFTLAQIVQTLLILISKGDVAAVQDEATASQVQGRCDKLNAHLLERARGSEDISVLASPLTGGGVEVPRAGQLFLLAWKQGCKTPAEIAARVQGWFKLQGLALSSEGRVMQADEDAIAHLTPNAAIFLESQLPLLRVLRIA